MLNIEQKEDSAQKLAAIAGKPTKNYLFAEEVNQIVSELNNLGAVVNPDRIISLGTETISGNQRTYEGYKWQINGVEVDNIGNPIQLNFPSATVGFKRNDISVFKADGTIERIAGIETDGDIVSPPDVPEWTLYFKTYSIDGNVVESEPEPPTIDGSIFKKKSENSSLKITATGEDIIINLSLGGQMHYIVTSPDLTSVAGFSPHLLNKGGNPLYPGQDLIFENQTGNPVTLINAHTIAPIKFNEGADIILPNGGKIWFRINEEFAKIIMKSWSEVDLSTKLDKDISTYSPATTPLSGTEKALIHDGTDFKEVSVSEFIYTTDGKSYESLSSAMAVVPLPSDNTIFYIDESNLTERGVYTYDSSEVSGYRFVRNYTPNGVVEDGNTQAVSGGEVFSYINYENLYDKMELPKPFTEKTLANILQNNNFNSIWGGLNCVSEGILSNVFKWKATAQNGRVDGPFPSIVGHVYYVSLWVKTNALVYIRIPGIVERAEHIGNGDWQKLELRITATSSPNSLLRVTDPRLSGWDSIEIKKGVVIDLTSTFGVGNEPNVEEMDEILSELPGNWFNPTYTYSDKLSTNGMTFVNRNGVIVLEKLEGKPLYGKKIVCFGDSITEFGDYPQQIALETGATVYDVGIGGTRLVYHGSIQGYDDLSFVRLTEAIITNDWTLQDTAIAYLKTQGDDNQSQYDTLRSINWNEIDMIVFMYGTNDYSSIGVIIGEDNDTTTTKNVKGCLNYIFQNFNTTFPKIELYAVTPIFRYRSGSDNSDVVAGSSGLFLNEIGEAIIHMAKKYHSPSLDLYNQSGINYYNALTYIIDGTHPTQLGYDLIAKKVSRFLTSK